jgi:hypothetical protein
MPHRTVFLARSTAVRAICALLAVVIAVSGLSLTASTASAETAPSIASDKEDYAPGELVTLTGAGWQPGESVHLTIDDEVGRTWQRQVDVTADDQGRVVDRFNLPDWFVASYTVLAEGQVSGSASSWFTDGNIKVYARTPAGQAITAQVAYSVTNNVTSCPTANPTNTLTADGSGTTIAGGANAADRVKLVAPSTVTSANGTHTFTSWTVDGSAAGTSLTLCAPGNNTGTVDIVANYSNGAASNAAPTANTTSTTVAEDGSVSVALNGSDTNTGDTLSFTVLAGPTNGTLGTVGAPACSVVSDAKQCTAQVTYTPVANHNGTDSFTYRVSDGTANATGTRNLTVTPVNDAPTASPQTVAVTKGTTEAITLSGTDLETPGSLTYTVVAGQGPSHGTLSGTAPNLTYTPAAGFTGPDSFKFIVTDSGDGTAAALTSAQATVSIDVTAAETQTAVDPRTATYGDTAVGLTATVTRTGGTVNSGAVTFTLRDGFDQVVGTPATDLTVVDGAASVSYDLPSGTSADDYTIRASYDGTVLGNSAGSNTLSIGKRPVTVTADPRTKTYGNADPALTYEITAGSLANSDVFTGALTREAGQAVGNYNILQGTLALNANYDLTYIGDELTITQRAVTVTADPQTKTYGNADPALTYEITAGSLAFSDDFTGALAREAGQAIGGYDILQGTLSLGSNYDLTYVGDELTITRRAVTVTADDRSKTYGEADPALTYEITAGSLAYDDTFAGALDREAGQAVGLYDITQGNLRLSDNYALTFVGAELTIGTRELTITADDQSKTFGESKDLESTAFGVGDGELVAGDSVSSVTLNSPGAAASASVAGGPYPITPSGAVGTGLENYDITYVAGSLSVDKAVLSVTPAAKTKTYGDAFSSFSGSIAGEQNGDEFTATYSSPGSDAGVDVGEYVISVASVEPVGDADLSNYTVSKETATLFVDKAVLTVTPAAKTKTYGDVFPASDFTGAITGEKNDDAFTAT